MSLLCHSRLGTAGTICIFAAIFCALAGPEDNAKAQTETNLYSFGGVASDGINPEGGLVRGSDGNFYGTTFGGGTNSYGTVFRISASGAYTNLYSFGTVPNDGEYPKGQLIQGRDGNFYGLTLGGGTNLYYGTIFRISAGGSYTNLYSFGSGPYDGFDPEAGLVQGSDGNLYGTTLEGGSNSVGTVFRISPTGSYANLYSFGSIPNDGQYPEAGLVQGSDGNFYGTTLEGGSNSVGTVFQISPNGSYTNLYSFGNFPNDGQYPEAGLVQGSDGNLYGTAYAGGAYSGQGTVFRISPSGTYSNLYSFGGIPNDGINPQAGLVQGCDGNFYGAASAGGANGGQGTVFWISASGIYSNLYSFVINSNDGADPVAGLVQGSDGNFYGTAYAGGAYAGQGTVFKLIVPLSPPPYPINQITSVKIASTNVVFSIATVAGETYQLQVSSSLSPTNWINVPGASLTNSLGSTMTFTNFGGATQAKGFYRFDITP
jgi:uncharacterized repeat protein (TIGR03803 family)